MQLFNVYQGGTLIFDMPTVTGITGHQKYDGNLFVTIPRLSWLDMFGCRAMPWNICYSEQPSILSRTAQVFEYKTIFLYVSWKMHKNNTW